MPETRPPKISLLVSRAMLSLLVAGLLTLVSASLFFNDLAYHGLDYIFFIAIPWLSLAWLFFWLPSRLSLATFLTFCRAFFPRSALFIAAFLILLLYLAFSPNFNLALSALVILLLVLTLLSVPALKQISIFHSLLPALPAFLVALVFIFGVLGFFHPLIPGIPNLLFFTLLLVLLGGLIGTLLLRRVLHSFHTGFLHSPLNALLAFSLPIFLFAILLAGFHFPPLFLWQRFSMPSSWQGWFWLAAFSALIWGLLLFPAFDRFLHSHLHQSNLHLFLSRNLPGFYVAGMFFLINLLLALSLNHPALNFNTVLFESDAGPWLSILGSPTENYISRSVHPLILVTLRPLVRLLALFFRAQWAFAPLLAVAAASAFSVFMVWLFVQRAVSQPTYSFAFAILLGASASHLVFGSLTDTYIFGAASLLFFLLLVQSCRLHQRHLLPAGLLVFGITITNIAQALLLLLFNRFGAKRLLPFALTLFSSAVILTVFTNALFPGRQTFFFVPRDILVERTFSKPLEQSPLSNLRRKVELVSRTMFLYSVPAPAPLEVIADKPPHPTIDVKTHDARQGRLASYKGFGNLPLVGWLCLLAGALFMFLKNWRTSPHRSLLLGLLAVLTFNFILHLNYGTELFLYACFWTYALVLFVALSLADFASTRPFRVALTVFIVLLLINNFWFLFTILRAISPFYAALPISP